MQYIKYTFQRYIDYFEWHGVPPLGGVKQGWAGGVGKPFSSYMRQYLENGLGDTYKVTIYD